MLFPSVLCRPSPDRQRRRLGDVPVFENRQPVTEAKFINKSLLFILLPGVIRWLELKPISEQKAEHIFVATPYCQTKCWWLAFFCPKCCPYFF
jgi:hypothetical protein